MRLGEIGISRKVYDRESGIMFRVAGQDRYGPGITTLLTDCVIGVRALEAAENGPEGRYPFEQSGKFGNNNYPLRNLHQWLNSREGPPRPRAGQPACGPILAVWGAPLSGDTGISDRVFSDVPGQSGGGGDPRAGADYPRQRGASDRLSLCLSPQPDRDEQGR